jgi:hypothetical protein
MDPNGLFNQTLKIYAEDSYNAEGREVAGDFVEVLGRLQETTKTKFLPNSATVTINAIAYLPADADIAMDRRVDYGTTQYKVYGIYGAVDGNGQTNHLKVELVKWPGV